MIQQITIKKQWKVSQKKKRLYRYQIPWARSPSQQYSPTLKTCQNSIKYQQNAMKPIPTDQLN
ncbi:hypothetical protein DsansV1_C11g0110721 [Dioscorea sansibarensis]